MNSQRPSYSLLFSGRFRLDQNDSVWSRIRQTVTRADVAHSVWISSWAHLFSLWHQIGHVAIDQDGVVLDSTIAGNRYYYRRDYLSITRGPIYECVISPLTRPTIGISHYEHLRSRTWAQSLVKLMTRGHVRPSLDCVDIARELLLDAGLLVPRSVVTPPGLVKYLRSECYAFSRITKPPPDDG